MPNQESPSLFSLMAALTAEERQKLGERRRAMKSGNGIEERLVRSAGEWQLEFWRDRKKIGALPVVRR